MAGRGEKLFENLHNLLWNEAGFTPERALEHLTTFFTLRLLEPQIDALLTSSPGLAAARWSTIAAALKEVDCASASHEAVCVALDALNMCAETRPYFRPLEIDRAVVVERIVRAIDGISSDELRSRDTLGALYEYMIGRGMSTMSDQGQYFTPREVCDQAFRLCVRARGPVWGADGALASFADFFCGTGGFVAAYIRGAETAARADGRALVDWRRALPAVFAADQSETARRMTLLNILILTGEAAPTGNVCTRNSFRAAPWPEVEGARAGRRFDVLLLNPPFGSDQSVAAEYRFKYSGVNDDIRSIGVVHDDKAVAAVQLAMATLTVGGVCAIVLPNGFSFGVTPKLVEIRRRLVEDYCVSDIVTIKSGAFSNTATSTVMVVFRRGVGPTDRVVFSDTAGAALATASVGDFRRHKFAFDFRRYVAPAAVVGGFENVRLGDLVTFSVGKFTSTHAREHPGAYPFYNGKAVQPDGTCAEHCFDGDEYIVLIKDGHAEHGVYGSHVGLGRVHLVRGKASGTSGVVCLQAKVGVSCVGYLYHMLKLRHHELMDLANSTTGLGHITRGSLEAFMVPVPSLERQVEIAAQVSVWDDLAKSEAEMLAKLERAVAGTIRLMSLDKPKRTLGSICTFTRGRPIAKANCVPGLVPVIGGGIKPMGHHNVSNTLPFTLLISQSGTAGHVSRYPCATWAADCFAVASSSEAVMLTDYLYYSVAALRDEIVFLATGTVQKHVYPSTIEHLEIAVPSMDDQQWLADDFAEIRNKTIRIAQYQQKTNEISSRLIPAPGRAPAVVVPVVLAEAPAQLAAPPAAPVGAAAPLETMKRDALVAAARAVGAPCGARMTKPALIAAITAAREALARGPAGTAPANS